MKKYDKAVIQAELDSEKEILEDLKEMYGRALVDTAERISKLSARTDMENVQSIIWQKNYQKVLQEEIEGALSVLHSDSCSSISAYLNKCYENGFVGVAYSLANQNIPLIMPINQKKVVDAITTDSKLSKRLYDTLGEDITKLKKNVRLEISRGVALGKGWNEVAGELAKKFEHTDYSKAYNRASVIARTEGHRVCVRSALDAQQVAKSKGADVVKQWDAALDGRTRSTHRQLDGQIRELDEDFEVGGMKAEAPGMFGIPSQDCNCRCAMLTRARWELDADELKALQARAEYYGLDKTESFEEYKSKYLQVNDEDIEIYDKTVIIKSGAVSGARNPYGDKADEHAKRYYGLVRSMSTDVAKISETTGMSKDDIQAVKNFIFMEKHDLGENGVQYFEPDFMMAESWRRLIAGNPEEHDMMMLRHELLEMKFINNGMSQDDAHKKASKKYNYNEEAKKYYAKIKKYKKE